LIPLKNKPDRPNLPCALTPLHGHVATNEMKIADFAALHKQKLRIPAH
jgi:hypothetical protein